MPCLYHFTEILREEITQSNPYKSELIYKDFFRVFRQVCKFLSLFTSFPQVKLRDFL